MKYVCLWMPESSIVEARGADIEAALLEIVPRVALEQSGLVWCDARGLALDEGEGEHEGEGRSAESKGRVNGNGNGYNGNNNNNNNSNGNRYGVVRRLLAKLAELGVEGVRAGVADVPIVAEIAARPPLSSAMNLPLVVTAIDSTRGPSGSSNSPSHSHPRPRASPGPAYDPAQSTVTVALGNERDFMARQPIGALKPDKALLALFDGVGIHTCGALAMLEREAVEVRFGADVIPLWRLARAEDARRIFAPARPDRIEAAIEFLDYVVTDPERLVFSTNALLGNVCDALGQRGEHARRMRITLPLANGDVWERSMRPARPTASRDRWLRLARALLERLTVPDAVAGVRLEVEAAEAATAVQGDLFDRGFATAGAVEDAIARLLEEQTDVLVEPVVEGHPLAERRARWTGLTAGSGQGQGQGGASGQGSGGGRGGKGGGGGKRGRKLSQNAMEVPRNGGGIQYGGGPRVPEAPASPAPPRPWPGPDPSSQAPSLSLQLLDSPRPIDVETVQRRDHEAPVRYQDRRGWHQLVIAAGPDRISGGQWEGAYAREYFRCVTTDGVLVWLFRDARRDSWHLHGWWD